MKFILTVFNKDLQPAFTSPPFEAISLTEATTKVRQAGEWLSFRTGGGVDSGVILMRTELVTSAPLLKITKVEE